MKCIGLVLLGLVITSLLFWLVGSFISLELDVTKWEEGGRFTLAIFTLFSLPLHAILATEACR